MPCVVTWRSVVNSAGVRREPSSIDGRIARGSFFDFEDGFCRASRRYEIQTIDSGGGMGFRVARTP
jgi:hypothetical protein